MPDPLKQYQQGLSNGQPKCKGKPLDADTLQSYLLKGVSRTFALTIPQLPSALRRVVSNAYLLCRTLDTIEDEPCLSPDQKRYFVRQFVSIVGGQEAPQRFATELSPLLSSSTIPTEHELIQFMPQVIGITLSFTPLQRDALQVCVRVMSEGMVEFQHMQTTHGLADLAQLDRYCYYVAGVVGEMLTKLFCDYSPEIAKNRDQLMPLAMSFGQGLQMTNILKDIWDDNKRDACWLPHDIFAQAGFDLDKLAPDTYHASFGAGLAQLVAITHTHLKDALAYTLLIPKNETGIREFCLWAIGMALLTLRKINRHRDFTSGQQVKISRSSVKATIIASNLAVGSDVMLTALFRLMSSTLPRATAYSERIKVNANV